MPDYDMWVKFLIGDNDRIECDSCSELTYDTPSTPERPFVWFEISHYDGEIGVNSVLCDDCKNEMYPETEEKDVSRG